MKEEFYVYIMTNKRRTVFYTGMTNDILRRVYEHRNRLMEGFTKKYNADQLVYFEQYRDPLNAIIREKQIKDYRRSKKIALISDSNPPWNDLYQDIMAGPNNLKENPGLSEKQRDLSPARQNSGRASSR